ncbi:MAG: hypothetical protein ACR2H3_00775 [Acidimicrobiales bacterium]
MARPSNSKKVSRAASTGGGRSTRSAKPLMWWGAMGLVAILGVVGIVFSREQRIDRGPATLTPPVANQDHWHAAYGVYLCDDFAEPIADQNDPKGIHTHADGIIHIHPFTAAAGGDNAVLDEFVDASGMTLTDSKIKLPGGKTFEEGKTKCGGKAAIVQIKVDGELITENVRDIKFADRQIITIAFAPKGAELPDPPSVPGLDNLSDVDPSLQQPPLQQPPPVPGDEGITDTSEVGGDGETTDSSTPDSSTP